MVKKQQTQYVSPQVEIVEIKSRTIICQSGDIDGFNLKPEDDPEKWS